MPRHPDQLFEDIAQFIDKSHQALDEGALMELAGMDDEVKALCEEITKISVDQRAQYESKLRKLFDDLQVLGDRMVAMRAEIVKDIQDIPARQKAHIAYRAAKVAGRPEKKDEEEE